MRRNARWTFDRSGLHGFMETQAIARFVDRHGRPWTFMSILSNELIDNAQPEMILRMLAEDFKLQTDRRYDDPFAFWPGLVSGRWMPR